MRSWRERWDSVRGTGGGQEPGPRDRARELLEAAVGSTIIDDCRVTTQIVNIGARGSAADRLAEMADADLRRLLTSIITEVDMAVGEWPDGVVVVEREDDRSIPGGCYWVRAYPIDLDDVGVLGA